MCESTVYIYIYTVYEYMHICKTMHVCKFCHHMPLHLHIYNIYMTKGRFTFNFKRFQKHLTKFDPKCMMKSLICFIV